MGNLLTQIATCYDRDTRSCCNFIFLKRYTKEKNKKKKINKKNSTILLTRLVNSEENNNLDYTFIEAVQSPLNYETEQTRI